MKTPDEIKKALECCANDKCEECPYDASKCVCFEKDALEYIQQLEAKNAELLEKTKQLMRKRELAKRRMDAALRDMEIAAHDACCVCHYNISFEEVCSHQMEVNGQGCFKWRGLPEV